ncbi:hypothetical protein AK812_SmicGene44667 [Symbiodinium microadriaticum]|uniref:Uncharacterized protein n=1 Tax=Symbiodinium microadriaticum TaxID=2951 RepID=A0A1Q9BXV4_SYMMI|nr:hypothetical protein AK812_SmicGene44667 [Symbiodinium microadriaticum]
MCSYCGLSQIIVAIVYLSVLTAANSFSVGGDYGRLTTTIEVDNSSVAVQDFNYLWPGFTLSPGPGASQWQSRSQSQSQ